MYNPYSANLDKVTSSFSNKNEYEINQQNKINEPKYKNELTTGGCVSRGINNFKLLEERLTYLNKNHTDYKQTKAPPLKELLEKEVSLTYLNKNQTIFKQTKVQTSKEIKKPFEADVPIQQMHETINTFNINKSNSPSIIKSSNISIDKPKIQPQQHPINNNNDNIINSKPLFTEQQTRDKVNNVIEQPMEIDSLNTVYKQPASNIIMNQTQNKVNNIIEQSMEIDSSNKIMNQNEKIISNDNCEDNDPDDLYEDDELGTEYPLYHPVFTVEYDVNINELRVHLFLPGNEDNVKFNDTKILNPQDDDNCYKCLIKGIYTYEDNDKNTQTRTFHLLLDVPQITTNIQFKTEIIKVNDDKNKFIGFYLVKFTSK